MQILVTERGDLQLEAPLDFRCFSIAVDPRASAGAARLALSRIARLDGESHAWVCQDGLRSLSGHVGDTAWEEGFAGMIAFAGAKGWLDELGRIRAHIESLSAATCDPLPAVEAEAYKSAMRRLVGGVGIVATGSGTERTGLTVSAITSVSAEPPCLLVCVNTSSNSHAPILANGAFSVSLLGEEHEALALRFAGVGDIHGAERFAGSDWDVGPTGSPLLSAALCTLDCQVALHQKMGSHGIFIGRVIETRTRLGAPLVNFEGKLRTLGLDPA